MKDQTYGVAQDIERPCDGIESTSIFGKFIFFRLQIIFGSSAIKSFAVTLLIGIILSLLTSLFVTRLLVKSFMAFDDENEAFFGLKTKEVTRG